MCFTTLADGIIIIYSYSLLHWVCYNGFMVHLPPFWDPVIFCLWCAIHWPWLGNLLLCLGAPFGGIVMTFIFTIIQGSLMGRLLPSSHCITRFVLLHHFFAQLFVNLDPLSDYVILIYISVLPIYVVRSCVFAIVNSF